MNIHITDIEQYNSLLLATIETVEIGSSMYGTNNENSDVDYLHIYVPSISEKTSFVNSHHQLQYKENGIDHIFINFYAFIRNCLNGDSTINYEVLYSKNIKKSKILGFLYDMRKSFSNYKIVRSYLGFSRRDIKQISKQTNSILKNKKLAHATRCLQFANDILNDSFNPYIIENNDLYKKISDIKNLTDNDRIRKSFEVSDLIDDARKKLDIDFNVGTLNIPTYMKSDDQYLLDVQIHDLVNSDEWLSKEKWYMNMMPYYSVKENDDIINY